MKDKKKKGPPILCFEEDLDAGLKAAKELATKGFAQMPDGYWMVSEAHAAKVIEQAKVLAARIVDRAPSMLAPKESQQAHGKLLDAFAELVKLLPGGSHE